MTDDRASFDLDAGPDPAIVAAAAPESQSVDQPVYAVGIGPGTPAYLTPRGKDAIAQADVVVGFTAVIDRIQHVANGELLSCGYRDEAAVLEQFATRVADGASGTAVLMGDPNHSGYQFLGKVEQAVDQPVRVIPGISSVQVAASRARTPLEATTFVTLHKSGDITDALARLRSDVGSRHLIVIPRPYDWMPGDIAAELLDAGADPGLSALVCERLTHDDEQLTQGRLDTIAETAGGDDPGATPYSDLSVLVVRAPTQQD